MADDWAGLAAQLGKMQQSWYVTQRSYWNVFDPAADTATIMAEDGSTRQVPTWRAISTAMRVLANNDYLISKNPGGISGRCVGTNSAGQMVFGDIDNIASYVSIQANGRSVLIADSTGTTAVQPFKMQTPVYGDSSPLGATTEFVQLAKTLSNGEFIRAKTPGGTPGRIAGMNTAGQMVFGDIDNIASYVSIQANGRSGVVIDGVGVSISGVLSAGSYTRATLPAASACPRGIAYITDGQNGPTHVFSNGQKWRIPTVTDL
ncbi:hypothetical protein [Chromobacterium violaceum]|uniref:hypothetical protein n=1 Tax=Chromobacterium violaceum TaxID=536 RepID=UPI0015FE346C|nr:hypothetical protein [Chromobacterium violaceum]MBA8734239.1 hypothetical protein [Chromobacterium violaceum]